jgi:hypothetical protein
MDICSSTKNHWNPYNLFTEYELSYSGGQFVKQRISQLRTYHQLYFNFLKIAVQISQRIFRISNSDSYETKINHLFPKSQ